MKGPLAGHGLQHEGRVPHVGITDLAKGWRNVPAALEVNPCPRPWLVSAGTNSTRTWFSGRGTHG